MQKSGFVGIIGRPNVGKSTLLNALIGEQIAITSALPQTTRNRIKGIYTTDQGQIVFIDTPGIHQSNQTFGEMLNHTAMALLSDADVDLILYMIDVTRPWGAEEEYISEKIISNKKKFIIILNKIDNPDNFLPEYTQMFSKHELINLSALNQTNIDTLVRRIYDIMPPGPPFFDPEDLTDQNMRFITAETIRKHVIHNMHDEIPHATAVRIDDYKELPDQTLINATIFVETDSQKKIMIGTGGTKIKIIKNFAKKDLKQFVDGKITLNLTVKVKDKWRKNYSFLRTIGYEP